MNPSPQHILPRFVRFAVSYSTIIWIAFSTALNAQTTLYKDNNFSNYLTNWTITSTGSSTGTIIAGGTPSGGDTNSLRLLNDRVNSSNLNNPSPDSLEASLNLNRYRSTSALKIAFDIKLLQVMDPVSGKASTNALLFGIKSSNGTQLFANQLLRWSGGAADSSIGFGDNYCNQTLGYVDPNAWYHVVIDLPGIGSGGDVVMTVTGLNGAIVHSGTAPYGAIPRGIVTQTVAEGLADYSTLYFKAGTSSGSYNANASITNLSVTAVPSDWYKDNSFSTFPANWTIAATGSSTATIVSGSTPSTGSDTSRLQLLNTQVNTSNLNSPTADGLSASLDLAGYESASSIRIAFDLKLVQVMDPVSGKATTNAFLVSVKSSNGQTLFSNQFSRWSGGTASSSIGFGDSDNYPTLGYVDPNGWYHVVIDLPGVGSPGNAIMTVTGLDGAVVHSGSSPYGAIPSATVTQAVQSGLPDYSTLCFKTGMSWGNFNANASITNISITTSPRSILSDMSPGRTIPADPTGSEAFTVTLPSPSAPQTISVAQFGASTSATNNATAFNTAIQYCLTNGISKLTVPTGVYRFTQNVSLNFAGLTDFAFDGQGSTFIFLHTSNHLMNISNCQRVLFKNFSVDWDWDQDPLASIVQIAAVAPGGDYADLRFVDYTRFPKRDVVFVQSLTTVDPATMSVGYEGGSGLFFGGTYPQTTWLSDNVIRMYANDSTTSMTKAQLAYGLKVGDYCRVQHKNLIITAINMTSNTHLTLSGVNVYSVPGFAFFTWGDQHHWQLLQCKVTKPPGVARAITCTSDGYHTGPHQGYFLMDGCEFGFGGDDCFNFADTAGTANKTGTYAITTRGLRNRDPYHVGDPIELRNDDYSPTGFTATISSITTVDAAAGTHIFTFSQAIPTATGNGFVLFNRRYGAKNIIIRNSYFHDNQARGFYLHNQNVTLENNQFFHNALGSLHINAGYGDGWAEGYGASNIVVRGNTFNQPNTTAAYPLDKAAAIDIYTFLGSESSFARTPYPILHDILIEGNQVIDFPGVVASVTSAQNVIIRNNVFSVTKPRTGNPSYRGGINVGYSSGVFILDNDWIQSTYMGTPMLYEDVLSTTGIYCHGNSMTQ